MTGACKRLSPAQRAQFDSQGYVAPVEALDTAEAAECARRLTAALASNGGRADTRLRNNPHLLFRWMADIVRDARVLDPIEDVLGPDLLVLKTTLFVKLPRDVSIVAWHQDLAYWDLSAPRTVTAWVAITDSTAASGCVRVVPGSHRGPLLDHVLGRDRNNSLLRGQLVDVDLPGDRIANLELRAGQLSLHHGMLLHSSLGNPSDHLRAGLAVRFVSPEVYQRGPRASAALVRGTDRYGHYDHEPAPRFDGDPVARAWHRRALRRYAAHVLWQIVRHPSTNHFTLFARLAARRDALRAMFR